jgi:Mg2+ and Co2+ transporter CorA
MALMAPPTLIASVYGMNIHMPGSVNEGNFTFFIILVALILLIAGGMLYYFHRKGWI